MTQKIYLDTVPLPIFFTNKVTEIDNDCIELHSHLVSVKIYLNGEFVYVYGIKSNSV